MFGGFTDLGLPRSIRSTGSLYNQVTCQTMTQVPNIHLACPRLAKCWKNIAQLFTQGLLLAGQLQKHFFSPPSDSAAMKNRKRLNTVI